MRYDHFGSQPPLRIACDMPGWPASGPGWHSVAPESLLSGAEADVLLLAEPDPRFAALGLPLVLLATDDTPPACLDEAQAFVLATDPPEDIVALLANMLAKTPAGVSDWSDGKASISALSLEAGRIAAALARLAAAETEPVSEQPLDAGLIRRLIRLRRDRDRYFPAEIFADPAWDMMLDLVASRMEGRQVAVSSLCIAAAVPTTTALRWIRSLSEAGIFQRATDPTDARRTYISLSDTATEGMQSWLRRFTEQFQPRN